MNLDQQKQKVLDTVLKYGRYFQRGGRIDSINVEVDDDLTVSVRAPFALTGKWKKLPVHFRNATDAFDIRERGLVSLEGSPQSCMRFYCQKNPLTSLKGCPTDVVDVFNCSGCKLTSLMGAPRLLNQPNWFSAMDNQLTDLRGLPSEIWNLDVSYNPLMSLEGLPTKCQSITFTYNEHLPLLRLLLVQDLEKLDMMTGHGFSAELQKLTELLLKYAGKGWAAIVPCAREMVRLGFKENARL